MWGAVLNAVNVEYSEAQQPNKHKKRKKKKYAGSESHSPH
jgi:hypothetical protein